MFCVFFSLIVAYVIAHIIYCFTTHQSKTPTFSHQNSDADVLEIQPDIVCPVEPLVGDGYCDDEANTSECNYDGDDCCLLESDRNECTNCTCILSNEQRQMINEDFFQDFHLNYMELGDTLCDLTYNTKEYFFDIGDCCLETEFGGDLVCYDKSPDLQIAECPDKPCIESNHYCIEHELGDGICQDHNNGPFCDYDLGDCCFASADKDQCFHCACRHFSFLHYDLKSF